MIHLYLLLYKLFWPVPHNPLPHRRLHTGCPPGVTVGTAVVPAVGAAVAVVEFCPAVAAGVAVTFVFFTMVYLYFAMDVFFTFFKVFFVTFLLAFTA